MKRARKTLSMFLDHGQMCLAIHGCLQFCSKYIKVPICLNGVTDQFREISCSAILLYTAFRIRFVYPVRKFSGHSTDLSFPAHNNMYDFEGIFKCLKKMSTNISHFPVVKNVRQKEFITSKFLCFRKVHHIADF